VFTIVEQPCCADENIFVSVDALGRYLANGSPEFSRKHASCRDQNAAIFLIDEYIGVIRYNTNIKIHLSALICRAKRGRTLSKLDLGMQKNSDFSEDERSESADQVLDHLLTQEMASAIAPVSSPSTAEYAEPASDWRWLRTSLLTSTSLTALTRNAVQSSLANAFPLSRPFRS